jgi:hypothetical protein
MSPFLQAAGHTRSRGHPIPESIANGGVLVLAAVVLVLAVAAADDTQPLETDVL